MKDLDIPLFWEEGTNLVDSNAEKDKYEIFNREKRIGIFIHAHGSLDTRIRVCMATAGFRAELHTALAQMPGIGIVTIDELRGKTHEEVKESISWGSFIDDTNYPLSIIEEEKDAFVSKLIKVLEDDSPTKIAGRLMGFIEPEIVASQIEKITAFEIKSIEKLKRPHEIFERETQSTKSFIKKINKQYANSGKNRRK